MVLAKDGCMIAEIASEEDGKSELTQGKNWYMFVDYLADHSSIEAHNRPKPPKRQTAIIVEKKEESVKDEEICDFSSSDSDAPESDEDKSEASSMINPDEPMSALESKLLLE